MKEILLILLFINTTQFFAQTKTKDTITRRANITYNKKANQVSFKPETPPLIPIAGAPKPSYSYFWEMGDGHYSKEPEPKHVYKNKGDYNIRLSVTNNYDNGKPPATRPKKVAVNEISDLPYKDIASIENQNGLDILKNCDPIPDQQMEVVVSYQNMENYVTNGKLYFFYNEKEFKNDNFSLLEYRAYAGEREIKENTLASVTDLDNSNRYLASIENAITNEKYKKTTTEEDLDATLLEANKAFKNVTILEFDGANPSETHNVFFTFKTTPQMIKDTSATITMRSVFVPNRGFKNHKVKNLEMQIVSSHDPNKMGSNGTLLNYRLVRNKRINFKTRFQNNGDGKASIIRLETDIPKMFDKKTLQIEDLYPKCPICPKGEIVTYSCLDTIIKKDQIHFTFKNIYLPGSNQKNVKELDSTKGFVKYSLKFAKDFHKTKTKSKTSIFFDKNEPVITNYATTRFKPGISIGAKIGYNSFPDLDNAKSYFVGATICPYKSYKFYWQSEIAYNRLKYNGNSLESPMTLVQFTPPIVLSSGTPIDGAYKQTTENTKIIKNLIDIVPVSLRYNINNYVGIGVGTQFSVAINSSTETTKTTKYYEAIFIASPPPLLGSEYETLRETNSETTTSKTFEKMQSSVFGDITLGFARIGPSLGVRYYKVFEKNYDYWQFYAIWKF